MRFAGLSCKIIYKWHKIEELNVYYINSGCYSGWIEEEGPRTDQVKLNLRIESMWISTTTVKKYHNVNVYLYKLTTKVDTYISNHQTACSICKGWPGSKIQLQRNNLSSKNITERIFCWMTSSSFIESPSGYMSFCTSKNWRLFPFFVI